jgi:hypothetical protein
MKKVRSKCNNWDTRQKKALPLKTGRREILGSVKNSNKCRDTAKHLRAQVEYIIIIYDTYYIRNFQ